MRVRFFIFICLAIFINIGFTSAASYYVSTTGNDTNPGTDLQPYRTIQKCADVVQPGDTCLVFEGVYPEHVITKTGGTNDNRITFKTQGIVTMQRFSINKPYVTIESFDITGSASKYYGYITVFPGGHYCHIFNNTIRDGAVDVAGIYIRDSPPANNCIIRGNILRNLSYTFLNVNGANHLVEDNLFERLNNRDYLYVFGHDTAFRRNTFLDGNAVAGVGNHPDWVQTFGDNGAESYNMLFEYNYIENLDAQLGQLNSGGGARGIIPTIRNWTFRRNVFVNVSHNMNTGLAEVTWEKNTFYLFANSLSGLLVGGSLTRGDTSSNKIINNAFIASGETPNLTNDIRGFYGMYGSGLTREVLRIFATNETSSTPLADGISNSLVANGYLVNSNGGLTNKAKSLSDISQFVINDSYLSYKSTVYDLLVRTVQLDKSARDTSYADYNFVAGSAPYYYSKRANNCYDGVFTPFLFCEVHGINGGNPLLQDIDNPRGSDGIPFTSDDGLIPLAGSLLCGSGEGGSDIGAYECAQGSVNKIGDINSDNIVNIFDLMIIVNDYGKSSGFDSAVDIVKDNFIDLRDITELVRYWGRSY